MKKLAFIVVAFVLSACVYILRDRFINGAQPSVAQPSASASRLLSHNANQASPVALANADSMLAPLRDPAPAKSGLSRGVFLTGLLSVCNQTLALNDQQTAQLETMSEKLRNEILTACAKYAKITESDARSIAIETRLPPALAQEFEMKFYSELFEIGGEKALAPDVRKSIEPRAEAYFDDFGAYSQSYVFVGNGRSLSESTMVQFEATKVHVDSWGEHASHPKGTFLSLSDFEETYGPLAKFALSQTAK